MTLQSTSILIPTRNRPTILATTLKELQRRGFGSLPLWVFDDASDDPKVLEETVQMVWPEAHLIFGKKRRGQAGARNILMKACGTEFGIMLDDDEYFLDAGGIEKHLTQYQEHQDRAVVSFKCVAKADGNVSPQGITTSQKISSFMGGNVLFHIPSVLSVGGYRDFFVYGAEEADLAFRLFRKGFHIWYDPSIVVEHNQWYSPDEHRDFREYDYLYARNFILLSSMNMPILIGLPHGFLKSLRWSISRNRNFSSKFKGITSGLLESVTRWQERQPCTFRQTITWLKRHKQSQK